MVLTLVYHLLLMEVLLSYPFHGAADDGPVAGPASGHTAADGLPNDVAS